jgi:hypothetical protein
LVRRTHPRRFWLIARRRTGGMEVLTTFLARGGEALPVFSFEDEANMFLRLGTQGDDWQARETVGGVGTRRLQVRPRSGGGVSA